MEIYVIRHTRVALEKGICYGQTDVEVGDTFLREVQYYKEHLPLSFDRVYSSDLKRCTQLAKQWSADLITDSRLRELNFGDWEMKNWSEIDADLVIEWSNAYDVVAPPNGEIFSQMVNRVRDAYQEWKKSGADRILVVAHAGVIRALWTILLEIPLKNSFKIPVDFGEIFVIDSVHDCIRKKG